MKSLLKAAETISYEQLTSHALAILDRPKTHTTSSVLRDNINLSVSYQSMLEVNLDLFEDVFLYIINSIICEHFI